jgi:2-hydroxychromene-2-carboxylate isomerase
MARGDRAGGDRGGLVTDQLRVYFGVRSPYARLGLHKARPLADRIDTLVIPFVRPAGGAPFLNPTDSPPKSAYYAEDAPRMTARMGLPFALPRPFEVDYAPANRAFYAAREAGVGLAFAIAASDARWGRGLDASDQGVIEACAREAGVPDGVDLRQKPGAAARDDQALGEADGVFGVPFAVLERDGKKQRFWGHERFDLLAEALMPRAMDFDS